MSEQQTQFTEPALHARGLWWLGVLGILTGALRVGDAPARFWFILSEFSWLQMDSGMRATALLYAVNTLLGLALVIGAVQLLRHWSQAPAMIVLVEKLFLIVLGLVFLWGLKEQWDRPSPVAGLMFYWLVRDTFLAAVYPILAIVILPPHVEPRRQETENPPL